MNIIISGQAQLVENLPSIYSFEDLSFETCNGFSVASFVVHRPITQYWPDLQYKHELVISNGETFWEGYIDQVVRSINPDTFQVNCLGWNGRLNELGTTDDINVAATYKLSTFLTDVVLADPDIELVEGDIATTDYAYTAGTNFSFEPYTPYTDAIEEFNKGNLYEWGVWEDKKLHFGPRKTSVDWRVKTEDCSDLSFTPNSESFGTRLCLRYTPDGTHFLDITKNDADSQALYGVITRAISLPGKVTTADANQIADVHIAEISKLRVQAEFTCNRIYDSFDTESPLGLVRSGDIIQLVDYLPTEETLTAPSDIATFRIASTQYNHSSKTLRITPTEFIPSIETRVGRLEATGY